MNKQQKGSGWFISPLKHHGWRFGAAAFLGFLTVVCGSAMLLTSGYLISKSALGPENILMVYVPVILVRTFGLGKAVIQYLEKLLSHHAVLHVLSSMRMRLYRALEAQAHDMRSRYRTGDLLGLMADDIEKLQHVYLRTVLPTIAAVLTYAAVLTGLFQFDVQLAWLAALYCGFLLSVVPLLALKRSRKRRQQVKQARSSAYSELSDALLGMTDWIVSGRSSHFIAASGVKAVSTAEQELMLRRKEWTRNGLLQLATVAAVAILVWRAGELAGEGTVAPVWIASLALAGFPILDAMIRIADSFVRLPEYEDSYSRLHHVEQGIPDASEVLRDPKKNMERFMENRPNVMLRDVSHRYPQSSFNSVNHIHLELPFGTKIALLGRSGAGKSTLLKLMMGVLIPDEGQVTVNGTLVHKADEDFSSMFSVLNQNPYLFDTTIENNIRLGKSDATSGEIIKAASLAGLLPLIESLPDGMNTRMKEAGLRFSGGERQRIALARVLLHNKPIVLLDEPMKGLDPITERALIETILQVLDEKTIVWVTHHISGMEQMDEILYMEQGAPIMRGTHEQLLKQEKKYRKWYALDHPEYAE